jgi:hypothetical protein
VFTSVVDKQRLLLLLFADFSAAAAAFASSISFFERLPLFGFTGVIGLVDNSPFGSMFYKLVSFRFKSF